MTASFSTPDTFGVRLGGLPVPMLDDLRSPELWHQVEAVLAGERGLAAAEAELSEALYALIGRAAAGKPRLVALRRAVHNRRALTDRYWNDEVRAMLPPPVVEGVRAWTDLLAAHGRDLARLDALVGHQSAGQHLLLRKAVADPAFQYGLVLSSPVLHRQVRKWLARPDESAPDRSLALRLTKYLARITMKTSPFSTFTVSGLGAWRDRSAGPAAPPPVPGLTVTTVAELNVWVVQQVVRQLSRHPVLAAGLRLRLNPSAHPAEGRWQFLGPGDEEPLRALPAGAAVAACAHAVGPSGRIRAEAARDVAARTGNDLAAADAYLGRLVELGLLEAERPFPDQALDPLAALRAWVAGGGADLAGLVGELDVLAARVAEYPTLAAPADRLRCISAVEAALRRVRDLAGPEHIQLPAKNTVIENALLTTELTGPARRDWAPVLRDLDVIRRCYAVLDPALPGRVALTDAFAARLGAGAAVPFLAFHRAVQEWLREDPELPGLLSIATHGYAALSGHRLPRIRELARLRAQLCAAADAGRADQDGVLRLAPARLAALADGWPVWLRPPDSVAFYGQPLGGTDPHFVVNAVNSGHGRGRDRIRRLLAQAGIAAGADTAPPPDGVLVADTCRHYGSNVGLRMSAVADEIDYPGGHSLRAGEHRIPLSDLLVRHDPARGLLVLWSRRRDAEVRPVHPNLIAELWLPPALRLLLQAFGATSNLLIPGRRMFGDPSLAEVDGMAAEPRVVIGRTTVSRRQWVFPATAVPVREKGERDRAYLLRLAAWLGGHGIPQRCFVRALDPASVVGGSVWRIKSRKPLYVDFANLLLLGGFERMLTGGGQVLFLQEALPAPADLPRYGDSGPRVTEFVIEINGGQDADAGQRSA
ncbi:lantibiotic dehydratase [Streptomyces sp. NPDC093097]|uniref:lantibiotic dehydratase n=1 Tax=Streptomyces sp. NPDC093097 TaxID=3366027 RepID=UPI0037F3A309